MNLVHCWLAVSAIALLAPAPAARSDGHRAQVERALMPAVAIEGQPSPTMALASEMRRLKVPGVSIAVIDHGVIAWTHGYGARSLNGPGVTPATRFQVGSISKSVTTLGVLRLAATGAVSLDRPVNDYLTSWKLPDSARGQASGVTLRRLLSHSAGINVSFFPGYAIGAPQPDMLDILDGRPPANTSAIRITTAPGSTWLYSGGGYLVAQQVVADVSHKPFAAWAKQAIFDHSMPKSSFDPPLGGDYALGHRSDGAPVAGGYHLYPEGAAAGLWTTASDLARLLLALSASIAGKPGAILPPSFARIVLDPVFPGETVGFDTGGRGANQWIAKGGDSEGYAAYLAFYPARGQGAVVTTNGTGGRTLAREVMRAIAKAYGWPDFGPRLRRAAAFNQKQLADLPGTYRYDGDNMFTIARSGRGLTIADPGNAPENLYVDPTGALFVLSQDADYRFKANGDGEVRVGHTVIPFSKARD